MMDSIFSILPMGLFGHNRTVEAAQPEGSAASKAVVVEEMGRKRSRDNCEGDDNASGNRTPSLISRRGSEVPSFREEDDVRPVKRFRGPTGAALEPCNTSSVEEDETFAGVKSPLASLPEDALAHCLSFLNSTSDRAALQATSKLFRRVSNSDEMMIGIQVGGDCTTGLHGIIQDADTPDTAAEKLMPFAMSGNLEALYM